MRVLSAVIAAAEAVCFVVCFGTAEARAQISDDVVRIGVKSGLIVEHADPDDIVGNLRPGGSGAEAHNNANSLRGRNHG